MSAGTDYAICIGDVRLVSEAAAVSHDPVLQCLIGPGFHLEFDFCVGRLAGIFGVSLFH